MFSIEKKGTTTSTEVSGEGKLYFWSRGCALETNTQRQNVNLVLILTQVAAIPFPHRLESDLTILYSWLVWLSMLFLECGRGHYSRLTNSRTGQWNLCVNKGLLGEEEWNSCLEVSQRGENKKILIPCHKLKFYNINMKESILIFLCRFWHLYWAC